MVIPEEKNRYLYSKIPLKNGVLLPLKNGGINPAKKR